MNKKILSIVGSVILSTSLSAATLKDYVYTGISFGEFSNNLSKDGEEQRVNAFSGALSVGFVKKETHRFSLSYQNTMFLKSDIDNNRINSNFGKLKLNYDFMIKNLDMGTAVYFGPSTALDIVSLSGSDIKDKVKLGGSLGARVGISHDFNDLIQLDLSYEKSLEMFSFNYIDVKSSDSFLIGLNFKY